MHIIVIDLLTDASLETFYNNFKLVIVVPRNIYLKTEEEKSHIQQLMAVAEDYHCFYLYKYLFIRNKRKDQI